MQESALKQNKEYYHDILDANWWSATGRTSYMTMLVPEPKASIIRYSDLPHKTLDIATPNIPNDRRKVKHWRKHCLHYQQKISPPLHFDGMSFVHVRGSSLNTATVIQDKRFCSSGKWGSTSIGSAIFNNACLGHLFSSERILHNKMTLWYSWYVSYVD